MCIRDSSLTKLTPFSESSVPHVVTSSLVELHHRIIEYRMYNMKEYIGNRATIKCLYRVCDKSEI